MRAQFPAYAKVGCLEVNGVPVSAEGGMPMDKDGKRACTAADTVARGGFGSDFDGIPVGDALYVSRRLDEKLQEAKKCMDAIDDAINNEW